MRARQTCLVVATCLLGLCGGCRSIRFGESEEDRLLKERQTLSNAQAGYNALLLNNPRASWENDPLMNRGISDGKLRLREIDERLETLNRQKGD